MKFFGLGIALLILVQPVSSEASSHTRDADDHLRPADWDKDKENYMHLLTAKLGVTPFNCGRVVDASSLGPELLISVYSKPREGRRAYYVCCATPARPLWGRTNYSTHEVEKVRGVRVRRVEAEIAQSIAEEIREVSLRMLERARPAPPLGLEFTMAGYLDFSIQRKDGHVLHAEVMLPAPGAKTKVFAKIYDNDLWEYCHATRSKQRAIADRIEHQLKWLLQELKRRKGRI